MKYYLIVLATFLFTAAIVFSVFAVTASAAEEKAVYYYVNSVTGDDRGNTGLSAASPVKTFTRACNLAKNASADVAYIVITNEYSISTATEVAHPNIRFVITTNDGKVDYAKTKGAKLVFGTSNRYYLSGDTTFENITMEYTATLNFVARYNPITMGEGVNTVRIDTSSRTDAGAYIVGGWQTPDDGVDTTLDSHITIKSGDFYVVVGGSRQYAASSSGGHHYTGTHHITVEGGNIDTLYGGTMKNHWSNNVVINVSGGYVETLYAAGDETRRVEGDATVTLSGGTVDNVNINNVLGNATVNALGTKIGKMSAYYHSLGIADGATSGAKKALNYSSFAYTADEVASFEGFDTISNAAYVFASAAGGGDGMSESAPTSFEEAYAAAVKNDASIMLISDITLANFAEPEHSQTVTVTSINASTITFSGKYTLGGKTVFDNLTLEGECTFDASTGKLVIAKTCTVNGTYKAKGAIDTHGGIFTEIADATDVQLRGGKVGNIIGGENATVEIFGGNVESVVSADSASDSFTFTMVDGTVDKFEICNIKNGFNLNIFGGEVKEYAAAGENARGKARLSGKTLSDLGALSSLVDLDEGSVFFISDGADGSGRSANDPSSSLAAAYTALSEKGGTIVVVGKFTVGRVGTLKANKEKITLTSVYGGVDYSKTNGAELVLESNLSLAGETEFKDITIRSAAKNVIMFANGNKLTLGDGITSYMHKDSETYVTIVGGSVSPSKSATTDVTINSGIWQRVYGGDNSGGSTDITVKLTVNGGEFVEPLVLGSADSFNGSINAVINGGKFYQGIYAATLGSNQSRFDGIVRLTFNGGIPYATVGVAKGSVGTYNGSFDVTVNGGEWGHLVELRGSEGLNGNMTSSLSGSIDFDAEIEGNVEFTNPIRQNGADPWLFYHDGFYYYTATQGHSLGIARAANIGDLQYAEYVIVYTPRDGEMWSKNVWSPEIHYYTDEEIGEGNGGWYCYIACDNGDNVYHRMYVIKCLDGDNLFGRWGNPVTGEVNVPQAIIAEDIEDFENTWAAGQTDIRINGKLYMMYVTETGRYRKGDGFYQTENLVEMTNPWTIVGQSSVICRPEYDWEKGGSETGTAPQVVEGGTAVYADDGTIYIIYSGSGYWTTEYQLGQLKYLGGDPLDINNWEKKPTSILYKSDEVNGSGHASYVRDHNGVDWICYHGYIGKDTSSGRYAFVEPYTADKNGVVIADGSGHPAPLSTVYTSKINPLPLSERASGFNAEKASVEIKMTVNSMTAYVNGIAKTLDAAPVIKNSRTMLPVRFVADNLGATVNWDGATKTVSVKSADVSIEIVIGATTAKVNGETVELDSPAYIEPSNNRSYLPVRVIAKKLGATVTWDDASKTATLKK